MIQSGIDPATFRFVAQYLNHCATSSVPQGQLVTFTYYILESYILLVTIHVNLNNNQNQSQILTYVNVYSQPVRGIIVPCVRKVTVHLGYSTYI
jgi:hypothetical protein